MLRSKLNWAVSVEDIVALLMELDEWATCLGASYGDRDVSRVPGSSDGWCCWQVRLWDLEDASCVGIAAGHMSAVGAVAFSKKRKDFFVSGSR